MQERLGILTSADPYIGKYFSVDYVRRVLRQTDQKSSSKCSNAEKKRNHSSTEEEMMMQIACNLQAWVIYLKIWKLTSTIEDLSLQGHPKKVRYK